MFTFCKKWILRCKSVESYTPSQFYKSQWQKSSNLMKNYIIYRWAMAIIFSVLLLTSFMNVEKHLIINYAKFFIYLTHWGFIICTVQAILAAYFVTSKHIQLRTVENDTEIEEKMSSWSLLLEIYWILYSMSVVSAFGITIIFWSRVYTPSYHDLNIMIFVLHGFNTVLMLLEVIVVAHPIKFKHFLWTFGFVSVYLIFSYVYYLTGGTNSKNHNFIYQSLDWNEPVYALKFCTSSLVFGFIIHICMWCFSAFIRNVSGASMINKLNQNTRTIPIHTHCPCMKCNEA